MRGSASPRDIAGVLSVFLKGINIESKLKEQTCILVWDEVVGERISAAAQPEFIRDGRLFAVAKSSVWANELNYLKADIIANLNARVAGNVVKEIVFKAGRLPKPRGKVTETPDEKPSLEGIQLTDMELETVEAEARNAGEEAAPVVARMMQTALKLERWKQSQGWTPCKSCGALQHTESGVCPVCSPRSE